MISTTHITTGAALGLAVGSYIPNPIIAIPAAFVVGVISHHILDKIIHTDAGSFRAPDDSDLVKAGELPFALADNIVGTLIILAVFIFREPSWAMLFGAAGGNFPDVFHHPPAWGKYTRELWANYFHFHETHHNTARGNTIPLGIVTNLALIAISLYYILAVT